MARRYPTYDDSGSSFSPRIVTPGRLDDAASRATSSMANTVSRGADRIIKFAFERGKETATAQGAAAGAVNPQETLAQFGGQRPVGNFYEEAAFDTAVKLGSVQIQTEARTAMHNAFIEAQKNKTDSQTFLGTLNSIREGYSTSLENLEPVTAALVNQKLEGFSQTLFSRNASEELKRAEQEAAATAVTLTNSYILETENAARAGSSDEQFGVLLKSYDEAMSTLGLTNTKSYSTLVEKLKTAHHVARVRGEFQRAIDNDKAAEYIEKFKKDLDKGKGVARGLFEAGKKTLGNEMSQWMKSTLSASKKVKTDEIAILKDLVRNGNKSLENLLPIGDFTEVLARAEATGDFQLITDANNLIRNKRTFDLWNTRSPAEINAAARDVRSNAAKDGNIDEYELSQIKLLEKMAASAKKGLENISDHYNKVNPENPLEEIDVRNVLSIQSRIAKIKTFAKSMDYQGVPAYLTDLEAEIITTNFSSMPVDQKIEYLAALARNVGGDLPAFLKQISKNDAALAQIAGIISNPGVPHSDKVFAKEAFRGIELLKNEAGVAEIKYLDTFTKTDIQNRIKEKLGFALTPKHQNRINTIVSAVVAARVNLGTYEATQIPEIIHKALGGHIETVSKTFGDDEIYYGGIVNFRGVKIPIPNSIAHEGPKSLDEIFSELTKTSLQSLPFVPNREGKMEPVNIDLLKDDTIRLMPHPKLWNQGFYFLTFARDNAVLQFSDGKPYILNLNDLVN